MNKADLVAAITDRMGDKKTAAEAVNAVIETIQAAVVTGDKVSLTGFGSFEMVHKPERAGFNPAKGVAVTIAESYAPKFRPGSDFKDAVNEGGKKKAAKSEEKPSKKPERELIPA